MHIRLETQGFEPEAGLESSVRRRLENALQRLGASIMYVDVFIRGVNGPKGGPDMHVLLRLSLRGRGAIAVDSRRPDWRAALAVCSRKARRCVRRTLRKQRRLEKGRIREFHGRQTLDAGLHLG